MRTPRGIRLSEERIVVAAVDAARGLRGFTIVSDPRLQRFEHSTETGGFQNDGIGYAEEAILSVALPDDPEIAVVYLYAARWNGTAYDFEQVAVVPFPSSK